MLLGFCMLILKPALKIAMSEKKTVKPHTILETIFLRAKTTEICFQSKKIPFCTTEDYVLPLDDWVAVTLAYVW